MPVTLRSLIPTPNPSTTVTTTLTGGNGRSSQLRPDRLLPSARADWSAELNASISTANAANTFVAELIDPVTGEAASTAATGIPAVGSRGQRHDARDRCPAARADPDPGPWTLAVEFYNQVSGTALSQPFTITLSRTSRDRAARGVAGLRRTTLPAGQPTTVTVKVKNTGKHPEAYFVDARLNQTTQLNLPR